MDTTMVKRRLYGEVYSHINLTAVNRRPVTVRRTKEGFVQRSGRKPDGQTGHLGDTRRWYDGRLRGGDQCEPGAEEVDELRPVGYQ
jgi:hypothetical protein